MIIDTHVHTFPPLEGPSGRQTVAEHMALMQRTNYGAINRPRRQKDDSLIHENTLWNGTDPGPDGLAAVNFRTGRFGRLEWTLDGGDVYLQWFAPSLQKLESPPEYMIVEMDYAGVDVGVLQNTHCYGRLDDYFADSVRRYPGRFIGTVQVLEPWAHTDEQLAVLERGTTKLGLRGLFYQTLGFWLNGYRDRADDDKYRPFWDAVERLGLVLFWDTGGGPQASAEGYVDLLRQLLRVLDRNPRIPVILPMAWPIGYFGRGGRYELPDIARTAGAHPQVYSELTYPIIWGGAWEYPYVEARPYIQQLCEWFGPEKLLWGSDMPNVERFCTYRQCYQFLTHLDFLTRAEQQLILGDTAARLFGLTPTDGEGSDAVTTAGRATRA
jgi:predicted TIM-barrel fold metal-dependent hydrolase